MSFPLAYRVRVHHALEIWYYEPIGKIWRDREICVLVRVFTFLRSGPGNTSDNIDLKLEEDCTFLIRSIKEPVYIHPRPNFHHHSSGCSWDEGRLSVSQTLTKTLSVILSSIKVLYQTTTTITYTTSRKTRRLPAYLPACLNARIGRIHVYCCGMRSKERVSLLVHLLVRMRRESEWVCY